MISVTLKDLEGNIRKCKCGNDSTGAVIGEEAYSVWCAECTPDYMKNDHIYIPIESEYMKFKGNIKVLYQNPPKK